MKVSFCFYMHPDFVVFVLCICIVCVIVFCFWLFFCCFVIVSWFLAVKNEITGFRVAKLQNFDVEECDLTFC